MAIAMKKTAAIAIAAGLTFAGSAGIATQDALAQDGAQASQVVQPSTIDPNTKDISLNIHKILNPTAVKDLRTGNPLTDEQVKGFGGAPVEGVKFEVKPIGEKVDGTFKAYDLSKTEEFNKAHKVAEGLSKNPNDPALQANLGQALETQSTDKNGNITFKRDNGLQVAAYFVKELDTEKGTAKVNGKPVEGKINPAAPFVMFVPMTNPEKAGEAEARTTWNYNVHAYPKNTTTEITKKISDMNKNVGSKVEYQISGRVPSVTSDNATKLLRFQVVDYYNSGKLDNLKLADKDAVQVKDAQGNLTPVPANLYEVIDGGAYTHPTDQDFNKKYNARKFVQFTKEGLTWLDENARGKHIVTNWEATFKQVGKTDGEVWNTADIPEPPTGDSEAKVEPNTPPETPPEDTPEVKTYLAKLKITKTGDGAEKPLAGAKFELHARDLETGKCKDGEKITFGEGDQKVESWTTGEDGTVTIDGLHITDVVDSMKFEDNKGKDVQNSDAISGKSSPALQNGYCLKEIQAPDGYERIPQLIPVEFALKDRVVEKEITQARVDVTVNNKPSTKKFLPATGGMGVLVMALAGLAIIGGGVYAARRNSQSA